jgi:hypothetical protein
MCNHTTDDFSPDPDPATTPTGTENIASIARSRITLRTNAGKESVKRNRAETNKDMPIGLKCM